MPIVVCRLVRITFVKRNKRNLTYVYGQVEQVEAARIWHSSIISLHCFNQLFCFALLKVARGEHGHGQVGEVEEEGSEDLFGDVEQPDLHRSTWSLAPPLEHKRKQSDGTQSGLYYKRKWT